MLAVIFTLACLTTCVGLITSCSQYFQTLTKKINYLSWVRILTLTSMVLANMGLNKILAVSVPVLNAIYPMAIVLIVLAMLDKYIKGNSVVYTTTIAFTTIVSVIHALSGTCLLYTSLLEFIVQLLVVCYFTVSR